MPANSAEKNGENPDDKQVFWATCRQAAMLAGQELLEWQGRFQVRSKARFDLVTEADLAAQAIIRETLSDSYLQYLWIQTLNENPNVIYVATEANLPIFKGVGGGPK